MANANNIFANLNNEQKAEVLKLIKQRKEAKAGIISGVFNTAGMAVIGLGSLADDVVQGGFTLTEKVAGGATSLVEGTVGTVVSAVENVVCGVGDPLFDALDDCIDGFFNLFSSSSKKK